MKCHSSLKRASFADVWKWKRSQMWALALKEHTETERRGWGRWQDTRGSCWVSVDGLTQFQGAQRSQNLISKSQIVILSSAAPVGWVHFLCSGRRWGRRPEPGERTALWSKPAVGQNWKWNTYVCVWNALKWKWARLLRPPVGSIHKEPELVWTCSSWKRGGGWVNQLRQWCSCFGEGSATPILETSEASSCAFNPIDSPTSHSEDTRTLTLSIVCGCAVEWSPLPLLIVQHSNYKAVCTD